jgi:phosphoglycerate kinase
MAYTFEKGTGWSISGVHFAKRTRLETAKELLAKAEAKGVCIHLPSDSLIADKFRMRPNLNGTKQ